MSRCYKSTQKNLFISTFFKFIFLMWILFHWHSLQIYFNCNMLFLVKLVFFLKISYCLRVVILQTVWKICILCFVFNVFVCIQFYEVIWKPDFAVGNRACIYMFFYLWVNVCRWTTHVIGRVERSMYIPYTTKFSKTK